MPSAMLRRRRHGDGQLPLLRELNDFIAPDRRYRDFDMACAVKVASACHEVAGVPHTESS